MFEANIERDKKKVEQLEELGWRVLDVLECEVKYQLDKKINEIEKILTC
jgi:G:T-mismatch repair DNA endonuclease (very short patch repair protein)